MKPTLFTIAIVLPLLAGFIPTAHAAGCVAGAARAGCAGPNGAAVAGPNGVHTTSPPAAGRSVTGPRGNTATKGAQSGCAFVNGKRVCQ
jgi:hypothetical protein